MTLAANEVEHGKAVAISDNRFTVDQERASGQRHNGGDGKRKPFCEIVTVTGDQANPGTVPAGHDAEAVVLDLVQPAIAARWPFGGKTAGTDRCGRGFFI
jgi:hypothetical protein